ncbi:MAG: AAA family ATPase [Candidatus Sericytochromatia bacterium]|nr:AAA family ATPase [Candidatus Tanganyikabacteria bacterium]
MSEAGVQEARFEVRGEVADEATGKVVAAFDQKLDREVALKTLHEHLVHSREGRIAFGGEMLAQKRLSHPRIREVFDGGTLPDGRPYYAMEPLPGRSLGDFAPLPADLARTLWLDALSALAAAHARGALHGGIEPDCLKIAADGRLRLQGFGLPGEAGLAAWRGDPAYAPPEAGGGSRLDPRADLFALGAVFYEALTRMHAFGAPMQVLREPAAASPVSGLRSDLDAAFAQGLMAALAWDRGARPPSAAACLVAMGEACEDAGPPLLLEGPLVGRGDMLERLSALLAAAPAPGRGLELVYLAGARGTGKSRLLGELKGLAAAAGQPVALVAAGDFGPNPYATLGAVAERLGLRLPDDEARRRALAGDLGDLDQRVARERTQAAWAELLSQAAGQGGAGSRPAVVLIDEAERADEASTRMLAALRRRAGIPVVAILAVTGALPEGAQGHDLGPLGIDAVAAIASGALGGAVIPPDTAALLRERAGGRPLLVRRLLQLAVADGRIAFAGGRYLVPGAATLSELPGDDLAVGRARMARLPYPSWQVGEALALLGGPQRLARLGQWIGMGDGAIAKAADALLAEGLVTITPGGGKLSDSLAEAAVLEDIPPDRRAELQTRIAAGLERLDLGDETAIPLAIHLEGAGSDRAATAAVRAAGYALARGCVDTADRMLAVAERRAAPGSGENAAVLVLRAEQSRSSGRFERAFAAFEKALGVLPQMANRPDLWGNRAQPTRSALLLEMADCRILAGRRSDAIKMALRAAEAAVTDGEAADQAVALALVAELRLAEGDTDGARDAAEKALEAAVAAGVATARADAAQILGELGIKTPGGAQDAVARLEDARQQREELGDLPRLAACELILGGAYLAVGQFSRAIAAFERGVARTRALGLPEPDRASLDLTLARACAEQGDFGPALALSRDVGDLARKTGDRAVRAGAQAIVARILAGVGRLAEADAAAEEALAAAREAGDKELECRALLAAATVAMAVGRTGAASDHAKAGLELAHAREDRDRACAFEVAWAEAALIDDDSYRATEHLNKARELLPQVADRAVAARLELMAARHAFERRQDEQGQAFLTEAQSLAKAAGSSQIQVEIALLQAKVETAAKKGEEGHEALARSWRKAYDAAHELGMPLLAIHAARQLALVDDSIQTERALAAARDAIEGINAKLPAEDRERFVKLYLGDPGGAEESHRPPAHGAAAKLDKQVADFARAFAASVGERTMLAKVLERIVTLAGADRGVIALLGPDGQVASRVAHPQDLADDEALAKASRPFIQRCLKERQPVSEADARVDLRVPPALVKGLDLCSVACVPLLDGESPAGVLYVERRSVRGVLSDQDMRLVEQLAAFASLAIGQARRREEREAQERLVHALRRIGEARTESAQALAQAISEALGLFP